MRPEREASEELIYQSELPKRVIKKGLGAAGVIAGIAPFLSDKLPLDLAYKGISKLFPSLGKLLNKGMQSGLTLASGIEFLREKLGSKEQKQQSEKKENEVSRRDQINEMKKKQQKEPIQPKQQSFADDIIQRFEQQYNQPQQAQQNPESEMGPGEKHIWESFKNFKF